MSNNLGGNIDLPLQNSATAWINADYPLSPPNSQPADGTSVATWYNMAGAQRLTYAQATSGSRPLFKTNVNVGKAGILFDGVDDAITCTGTSTLASVRYASNTPFSMIFTFKMLGITVAGQVLESMRGSVATDKTTLGIDANGNLYWEVNSGGTITTIATPFSDTTKPHIVVVTSSGVNVLSMYLDGVQITGGSATSTTSGSGNTIIIGNVPALTKSFNGYIFDHVHFQYVVSSTIRQNNTLFFANLRGIQL